MQQDNNDKDIQRLERGIEDIRANFARLSDVDRRFAEDRVRIQNLEAGQIAYSRMQIEMIDRIEKKLTDALKPVTDQIEKLDKKVDGVDSKVDNVKDKHSESTALTLRYIVSVIVSFVLGSGVIGAFQYFESVIRK